nr:gustatory receptor 40 [Papilio machaon]
MFKMYKTNTNKVTPIENSTKINNYINVNIADRLKYVIHMEILIGINRIYLLNCNKVKYWLTQLTVPFLFALIIYLMIGDTFGRLTFTVLRNTFCLELICFMFSGSYFQRSKLSDYFRKMGEFDQQLNIKTNTISPRPILSFIWTVGVFIIVACEYVFILGYFNSYSALTIVYLGILAHVWEISFYCNLLDAVLVRIRILKQQVQKMFSDKENKIINIIKTNKIEMMNFKSVDISVLHNSYELLQDISEDLNSSMSFPMIVMFISSGIVTIVLLNFIFKSLETNENAMFTTMVSSYAIFLFLKMSLLLISPCYISNNTYSEVKAIRTILYDALNCKKEDKLMRRKIKGFYRQTRDNDFAYVLWGMIRLDMSLPLSYSGLCATYLVIVLQFSKFFD